MRRSQGKEKAIIYDFVALLPQNDIGEDSREIDFFKNELSRVAEFARHSLNPVTSLKPLNDWLERYDLYHLAV